MSSVTIGRDLQSWRWGDPGSDSGPVRGCAGDSRPAPAARSWRARTLWSWPLSSPPLHRRCCNGRSRSSSWASWGVRVAGSVRLAHHPECEQGRRHLGGGRRPPADGDRRLRRLWPAGPPLRAGGPLDLVSAPHRPGLAYIGIRRARTRGALGQRVLIVGAGPVAERFADALELNPSYGLHPIGLLDDCADDKLSRPVLGGIDELDRVLRITASIGS